MRAVIQRVQSSKVVVDGEVVGEIRRGLCCLIGVGADDSEDDAKYLADKIVKLRVFSDDEGKMNLSVADVGGQVLAVSQFTLYGDCRRGRRPGFSGAAPAGKGRRLYEVFCECVADHGVDVATGVFQAHMQVEIINDGPVTLLLDSNKIF